MRQFLRDTWPYILLPFVLLGAAILFFVFVLGDSPSPFVYNLY